MSSVDTTSYTSFIDLIADNWPDETGDAEAEETKPKGMLSRLITQQKRRQSTTSSSSRLQRWLDSEPHTPQSLTPVMLSPMSSPMLLAHEAHSPFSHGDHFDVDETFSLNHPKPKSVSPTWPSPARPQSPKPTLSRLQSNAPPRIQRTLSHRSVASSDPPAALPTPPTDPITNMFGPLHLPSSFSIYQADPLPKLSRSASSSSAASVSAAVDAEARGCFNCLPRPTSRRRFTLEESGGSGWNELEGRLREYVARADFVHVEAS